MFSKLRMKLRETQSAFTLIELLIVIAIIGILTVAFLPTLRGSTGKARDAAKVALVSDLSNAFESQVNDGVDLPLDTVNCIIDYSVTTGADFAKLLKRVPQNFPDIAAANAFCPNGSLYYKKLSATSYILGIAVDNQSNSNMVNNAAAAIMALTKDTVGNITDSLTNDDTKKSTADKGFYYVVAK